MLQADPLPQKPPIDIADRLELMLDDYLIDSMHNLQFRLHHPHRDESVLVADKPWEGNSLNHITIFKDGDLYRMYYSGYVGPPGSSWQNDHHTCYAQSRDGIHWIKPNLGLFEWQGSKENNIVWIGGKTPAPFKDSNPKCPPDQIYKAFVGNPPWPMASPDGIHWRLLTDKPLLKKGRFGFAFWNPTLNGYMAHVRARRDGARSMAYITSTDFINWSEDPILLDLGDSPLEHLYWNTAVTYFRSPNVFLGFPMRLAYHQGVEGDRTDVPLTFSRDGIHINRKYMEAFLRAGLDERNWRPHCNMMALGIVPTGENEMSMYYNDLAMTEDSNIRRVTLRTDGFVSINAPYAGGEFTTKPMTFTGNQLVINVSTGAAGSIVVEIQDENKNPIPGFTQNDSIEFFGDTIANTVKWRNDPDLAQLAGKIIRLRFIMKDADLYSLQFVN